MPNKEELQTICSSIEKRIEGKNYGAINTETIDRLQRIEYEVFASQNFSSIPDKLYELASSFQTFLTYENDAQWDNSTCRITFNLGRIASLIELGTHKLEPNKEDLKNVCDLLVEEIERKNYKNINSELVKMLLVNIHAILISQDFSCIPDKLFKLTSLLQIFSSYGKAEWRETTCTTAFNLGRLFSLAKLGARPLEIIKEKKETLTLAEKYSKYRLIFDEINNNPGITPHVLAVKYEVSIWMLVTILLKMVEDGCLNRSDFKLVSSDAYYLSEKGEEVLNAILNPEQSEHLTSFERKIIFL